MDQDLTQYIDYYLQNKGVNELVYTSALAVFLSFVALITTVAMFFKQRKAQIYDRLSKDWHDIVSTSKEHPSFFDVRITEKYYSQMSESDRVSYQPFCLIVWGLVEEIISIKYHKHKEFSPILQWAVSYHITWLDRNPIFFRKKEFWDEVDRLRKQPQSVTRHSFMPKRADGTADWDSVANTYFDYILSPFDPLMYQDKKTRNPIGDDIARYAEQLLGRNNSVVLMDHGCGIGNLYSHIRKDISKKLKVIGVDWSQVALDSAQEKGQERFQEFVSEKIDFRNPQLVEKHGERSIDIVVSVASLGLEDWESINQAMSNISRLLKPGGLFFIIAPAFEAIDEWLELWTKHYEREFGIKHAQRIKKSWEENKQLNRDSHTFAEDGTYPQCFFVKGRLIDLLERFNGLVFEQEPKKIFYPWELINRFDYGLYGETDFELYDWYAIAKRRL